MEKQIKNLIMVVVVLGIAALYNQALAEQASGVWVMEEQVGSKLLEKALGKTFVLRKYDSKVLFFNMQNKKVAEGTILGNSITATMYSKCDTYTIKGVLADQKLVGTFSLPNGQQMKWKATKLNILYKCGNHDPAHTATSLKEMQRLTKEKGCSGWSIVR